MAKKAGYHHGDLRRALLDAAVAILAESGNWEFSLRELARRAGVTHNAPYAHFSDKGELLAAVSVAGYETLRSRMIAAAAPFENSADALRAIGGVYVQFGAQNPAHYRLMFGPTLMRGGDAVQVRVSAAANESRAVLRDLITRGSQSGILSVAPNDQAIAIATLSAWSVVHGLTMLYIDGLAAAETDLKLDSLIELVGAQINRGLVHSL